MVTNTTDNLIFQSYYAVMLIKALDDAKRANKNFFDCLPLSEDFKSEINENVECGLPSQGFLVMFLYALLVLPRELFGKSGGNYEDEYSKINETLNSWSMKTESTYDSEHPCDYIFHIRNAVSHGRVSFEPKKFVRFEDENKHKKDKNGKSLKFSTEMLLKKNGADVGEFLTTLLEVHKKYGDVPVIVEIDGAALLASSL